MKDYFGFQGKNVVVTGASSGMGEVAAKMLVDLGAEVHACGSGNRSRITYGPAKEYYYDLSEKAALDALITALLEKIDALFVCQGISQGVNPDLKVMKVNFLSVKYLVEALAPRIADNGSVSIISSSGGFGWEQTFANLLKWYLCRLKPQLIRAISKITLFMPLLRNRSYLRFAFISP